DHGDLRLPRLLDRDSGAEGSRDLAPTPVSGHECRRRRLLDDRRPGIRLDPPLAGADEVARDELNPVRVVPGEVAPDQDVDDLPGEIGRRVDRLEETRCDAVKAFGRY